MSISKRTMLVIMSILICCFIESCSESKTHNSSTIGSPVKILFLHHSTGKIIWSANNNQIVYYLNKVLNRYNYVPDFFDNYNKNHNTQYIVSEKVFPNSNPYGWRNYPFDYYNIWVKNAGDETFMEEPTLEMLTKQYDVIIFKHCYPGSNIMDNTGDPEINSERKSLENYKLQYNALKDKMREFPETKYIVWTIPALVKNKTTQEQAVRADRFSKWMKEKWDDPDDNIFIWDFRMLEIDETFLLKPEYARSENDSHPNTNLATKAAPLFCQRIIDIIETNGVNTTLTGEIIY